MDELEIGSTDNEAEFEGEPQEPSIKEKQAKAYQAVQSEKDRLANELQKEREERIRIATRLEERERLQKLEQREIVPQKPSMPVMPEGFNFLEASTDEHSVSAKYMLDKIKYDAAKSVYDEWRESKLEQERETRLQSEQRAKQRLELIKGFQEHTSAEEAAKLADIIDKGDFETIAKAYKAYSTKPNKNEQTEQIPLPPGVIPNPTGATTMTDAQRRREAIKKFRI